MCGGQVFWRKAILPGTRDKQGAAERPGISKELRGSPGFRLLPAPSHADKSAGKYSEWGQYGRTLAQVTCRERNPESSTGGEESKYEPPLPGDNVSVGQLKALH